MPTSSKRARVMGRSMKLGHCICDPRKKCPCDLLVEKDVCACAGERPGGDASPGAAVALTQLVRNAGCASKIPPADLARVLARLPVVADPRLLVGTGTADDAGVFQISEDLCLVQSVDVFAPCVDDPYLFGRIAACNSLSDIYAMGVAPLTALSIVGYPIHVLADEWLYRMLKGGMDTLAEAGVALIGGHSINDEEIKLGFAVTGVTSPGRIITNAGAQPGDALLLTKPIGTGIICFAAQLGRASEESLSAATAAMLALNRSASQVMQRLGAHACTDVTGFGLLGHLAHMVRASRVAAEIWWEAVPYLVGASEHVAAGVVPGAVERNREFAAGLLEVDEAPDWAVDLLCDPQTSGGLLMAVAGDVADRALAELRAAGCDDAAIVGCVTDRSEGKIMVSKRCDRAAAEVAAPRPSGEPACPVHSAQAEECCAPEAASGAASAAEAFRRFMAAAFAPGALDVVQKELMTIALSVAVQCEPCLKLHLDKARSMGIAPAEIEEAAWMGVAFGGCKAMMFWQERSRACGT